MSGGISVLLYSLTSKNLFVFTTACILSSIYLLDVEIVSTFYSYLSISFKPNLELIRLT